MLCGGWLVGSASTSSLPFFVICLPGALLAEQLTYWQAVGLRAVS
jgi:hypothetical protein